MKIPLLRAFNNHTLSNISLQARKYLPHGHRPRRVVLLRAVQHLLSLGDCPQAAREAGTCMDQPDSRVKSPEILVLPNV